MDTIKTSEEMVKKCIKDLYITPRKLIREWSSITNQTCQIRMAYPGQHLASVITGIRGIGTAARGDDLSDGSEVKSCSRADQLSQCKSCGTKVLVLQEKCPKCGSDEIDVKTDSHWIFSIKNEDELNLLLDKVPRIILILFDKESSETDDIRLRAWIVDPKNEYVREFFKDYYYNNYLKKTNPAPCNLHPLLYDFFLMKPKLIFHVEINIGDEDVEIKFWNVDNPRPEKMSPRLLTTEQLKEVFELRGRIIRKDVLRKYQYVPEDKIERLKMRKKVLKKYKKKYTRR